MNELTKTNMAADTDAAHKDATGSIRHMLTAAHQRQGRRTSADPSAPSSESRWTLAKVRLE